MREFFIGGWEIGGVRTKEREGSGRLRRERWRSIIMGGTDKVTVYYTYCLSLRDS